MPALTYKPDSPRHQQFKFFWLAFLFGFGFLVFVCLFVVGFFFRGLSFFLNCYLFPLFYLTSVPKYHPIIFTVHPPQRCSSCLQFWHLINEVSSVRYKKFKHLFAKGKGCILFQIWVKSGKSFVKGNCLKLRDSFFCTELEPHLVQDCVTSLRRDNINKWGQHLTTKWSVAQITTSYSLEPYMLSKLFSIQYPQLLGLAIRWKNEVV